MFSPASNIKDIDRSDYGAILAGMSQAERILNKFPSESELARRLGIQQSAVNGWSRRGFIPARRQQAVLDEARKMRIHLEPADFFEPDYRT